MTPTRRRFLGAVTGAVTATGGCLVMDTHDDSELALHLEPVPADELGSAFLYTREEWTPAQRALLERDGPNATEAFGYRPFDPGDVVEVDGTYYAVFVGENGTGRVVRPVLVAEPGPEPSGPTGDFAGLAETDGLALRCAVTSAEREEPAPCVVHGGNHSEFLPEPAFRWIEHREAYYRLSVDEREVELDRYEYRFQAVAENRSAFARYAARELLAVDYDAMSLSSEEREVLRTAAGEGVYRESPPPYSDALRAVVEAFRNGASDNRDYVKFGGEYYLAWATQVSDD